MKPYATFAEWKRNQTTKHQTLIASLARLVRQTIPDLTPTVKWGQGCWTLGSSPKIYIHAHRDHVQFGFFAGSKLKDPDELLVGSGKFVRHVKIFTSKDIRLAALTALLKQVR